MLSQRFRSRASVVEVQLGRLAECDASLSLIASDVTGLREELAELRAEAADLARQLSERDQALALLDREHAHAREQASRASASLREAEARLDSRQDRIATLEREQELLRGHVDERERRLKEAAEDSTGLTNELAQRERMLARLEREHADALQQAGTISAALSEAEAQLEARQERLVAFERDQERLHSLLAERERGLRETTADQASQSDAVAERERTIWRLSERARNAERERAAWQQRSAALARELDSVTAEHERLQADFTSSRLPERTHEGPRTHGERPGASHLRLLCLPSGYTFAESGGPCPRHGDVVDVDGTPFVAFSVGRSPLPLDRRECVFLMPRSDVGE